MTPEDYGMVSMFLLLVSFASPFVGLNVNGAITRKYYDREDIDIWSYVFNCFLILIASTVIVGMIFLIFSIPISKISSFPARSLWMVVIYSFSQFISNILLSLLQVQKKAFFYGLYNNIRTLVNVGLSILLVVGLNLGWQGRIYGQFGAMISFAAVAIVILIKNKWIKVRFNKKYIYSALVFGVPLIPHALSSSIISMTDRFFITNMVGLATTGVYTVGYQIGSIINLLASSFNNAYVPWLFEKLKANESKTKIKIVKFTYLYFAGILILAVTLGILAPSFLDVFLGKVFMLSG
jgi:O-antigen/teichoic acid export membrane protein